MRPRLALPALLLVSLVLPASAGAQATPPTAPEPTPTEQPPAPTPEAPNYPADTPQDRQLYEQGPSGRYLMGGTWLFRFDQGNRGLAQGFMRTTSTAGWVKRRVPYSWNATDPSNESFLGGVGWYRKDFRLPSGARDLAWIVRFESVNYRSRVWLNGRPLGSNRGAYLPFELRLPSGLLKRGGVNRLVVRVDNRRFPTDFPPSNLTAKGVPTGGWWNYGGLLREVYLRRVDRLDITKTLVRPELPCARCDASIRIRTTVRNVSDRAQRVRIRARVAGKAVTVGFGTLGPKRIAVFATKVGVRRPRLWSPASPALYDVEIAARAAAGEQRPQVVQRWNVKTGIRKLEVDETGKMTLNGQPMNVRGFGYHEEKVGRGFAIDNATRLQHLEWARDAGATMMRSHYPLHPYMHEAADRLGMLIWSEIPVYSVRTNELKKKIVRDLATKELRDNIEVNGNHPSIVVWSIGNELSARPGPVQGFYISRAARLAKELDPTRPVGYAVAGYPAAGCQPEYGPLDVLGVNLYFGWYPGPNGQIADRTLLSEYLDQVRRCYPAKALFASEFGAEANRAGPVEEKGTYAFQQDWSNYNLAVFASKPWLSGALYWALHEFWVRPGWEGGNPRPQPPIHQKGVIDLRGNRKPAFGDLQRSFQATQQFGPAPARRRGL